jgi:hypothetical protein
MCVHHFLFFIFVRKKNVGCVDQRNKKEKTPPHQPKMVAVRFERGIIEAQEKTG